MVPLIVMTLGIAISAALGRLGVEWLASGKACVRAGMAAMFLVTGGAHFTKIRRDLVRMVPPFFPQPEVLVTLTGVAEFAGAAGLVVNATATLAACGLILLLALMLPANIYAARHGLTLRGRPATALVFRIPMQVLWIGLLWWAAD